ncbi:Dihydrofolate reductase folM [Kluyvera cryocrescens]|uniref:Dihydromonapterin reductase n=1 Tax=Kluyvera cryocrescens TaxID=580 RepID=A0A485AL73_KLUCR|nr:Dihydrofolate reductase folM [Kluyvera cryocrescens]
MCIQADFSTDEGIYTFADKVREQCTSLRGILHNASGWLAESPTASLSHVLNAMLQIHVHAPYLLNHALEDLLRGHGHAEGDIIHFTDYVVERGSDKHIAYAASKAALDNMTRSFARKLAPEVKVNAIAPALVLFNEHDDEAYRQKALNKSLMKIAAGGERDHRSRGLHPRQLLRDRPYLCGRWRPSAGLVKTAPQENQQPGADSPTRHRAG